MSDISALLSKLAEIQERLRSRTGSKRLIVRTTRREGYPRELRSATPVVCEVLYAPWSIKKATGRLGDRFLEILKAEIEAAVPGAGKVRLGWYPVSLTEQYKADFFPRQAIVTEPSVPVRSMTRQRVQVRA